MLLQPEMLQSAHADVRLLASLVALSGVIPAATKDTACQVVRTVVDQRLERLQEPMRSAVSGARNRSPVALAHARGCFAGAKWRYHRLCIRV